MIIFESLPEQYEGDEVTYPHVAMSMPSESSLPDVIEVFETFLLAAGYRFKGRLDFVDDEPSDIKPEYN